MSVNLQIYIFLDTLNWLFGNIKITIYSKYYYIEKTILKHWAIVFFETKQNPRNISRKPKEIKKKI
jgi:hypothetical protein